MRVNISLLAAAGVASALKAVVYRGNATCCAESLAHLLETSAYKFEVTYAGEHEKVDVTAETLADAAVYAHGGGPDLDQAWALVGKYNDVVQKFVSNGGTYFGFCLGAYLAGPSEGYNLLPKGAKAGEEIYERGAQVKNEDDTIIQVDWQVARKGQPRPTKKTTKWQYFQDGVVLKGIKDENVLARYHSNGDIAASVTKYGKGHVGLVGPHPEATKLWYDDVHISNPEGYHLDMGWAFVETVMAASKSGGCK